MICPGFGNANSIILSDNRCKIESHNQLLIIAFTAINDDRLLDIMAVDPFKALVNKVCLNKAGCAL